MRAAPASVVWMSAAGEAVGPGRCLRHLRGHMTVRYIPILLAGLGCAPEPVPPEPPGTSVVIYFARDLGVGYTPSACDPRGRQLSSCRRSFADGGDARLRYDRWFRPYQVTRHGDQVSWSYADALQDSLARMVESRGARRVNSVPLPPLPPGSAGSRRTLTKWCLDSAVIMVGGSWAEGGPFAFLNFLVAAVPDQDCSPGAEPAA